MSELTPCNYCSLQRIKARAKQEKMKITVLSNATWGMGGYNIYKHPKNINIRKLAKSNREDDKELNQYCVSWMMEIPDRCCC